MHDKIDSMRKNNRWYRRCWKSFFERYIKLSRKNVIERLEDGWMIVDVNNCIVDVNPAGEKLLGMVKKEVRGKPVSDIMAEWHIIINPADGNRGLEVCRVVKGEENWLYYNIRVTSLYDPKHHTLLGYLFTWQDITQKKIAEDALQKAREELFVLLNGISSAASHSTSLEEFLLESINLIIYAFRSQAIAVFLADQDTRFGKEKVLALKAQIGFSTRASQGMDTISSLIPLWQQITKTKRYILIDDPHDNLFLPKSVREMGFSRILVLPLLLRLENAVHVTGCLVLATNESQGFARDEIVRLNIISDHISQLIEDERRRHTFIALSERQRLLRDLHDSVSQKLYGLVAMTEAAQATLEAGSKFDPVHVLTKIGDNARQAVKEMRLFLHEMQPFDLEKEGLVSALNHRLAAVEGRADVKTRLLVDEKINLSKEEEIALYFIAQEALNNTLKHAQAKSVSMVLKKTRSAVVLEILDDGIGFDKQKIDQSGMGLKNMQYRAALIAGVLQITSSPGKGTRVVVKIPKPITKESKNPEKLAADQAHSRQREVFSEPTSSPPGLPEKRKKPPRPTR